MLISFRSLHQNNSDFVSSKFFLLQDTSCTTGWMTVLGRRPTWRGTALSTRSTTCSAGPPIPSTWWPSTAPVGEMAARFCPPRQTEVVCRHALILKWFFSAHAVNNYFIILYFNYLIANMITEQKRNGYLHIFCSWKSSAHCTWFSCCN